MMTVKVVFDTSAFLAIIKNEHGADVVAKHLAHAYMSTVNVAEVVTYLTRNGYIDIDKILQIVNLVKIINFDQDMAIKSGTMISVTKKFGLSLGDRVCLATAKSLKAVVYTADKKWSEISGQLGVEVIQIR